MELSKNPQSKNGPNRHPIDHWGVGLPIIDLPLLYESMGSQAGFLFDDTPICIPLSLEGPYLYVGILTIYFSSSNQGTVLVMFISTHFLPHGIHKVQTVRLACGLLEGEGVIYLFYV